MLEKQRTAFTYQQRPPRPPERKGEQMATRQLPTLRRCAVETASPSDPRTQMGGDGGSSEEKKWNKPQPPKIPAHVFGGWGHLYFAVRVLYFKFQTPHPRSPAQPLGTCRKHPPVSGGVACTTKWYSEADAGPGAEAGAGFGAGFP